MEDNDVLPEGQTQGESAEPTETPPVIKSPVKVNPVDQKAVERLITHLQKLSPAEPTVITPAEESKK